MSKETSKRENSSQIIPNLDNEQEILSTNKFQKQLSVQDTIQRHFSQILKNDSIIVTDQTSMTETLLMKEDSKTLSKY